MRAPLSLDPADIHARPMARGLRLLPWARVKDDAILRGPSSIAVPGVAAGMDEAIAHRQLPWRDLLSPAVSGRRRPAGGLWTTHHDLKLGRRPAALSGEQRRPIFSMACRRIRNGRQSHLRMRSIV